MKKRVFIYVLTLAVMLMPAVVLAEDPRELGHLVIDQGDMKTYLIHEDWESIQDAMGEEEIIDAAAVKAKLRVFMSYTASEFGTIPNAFFSVSGGESPWFVVYVEIITEGYYTVTIRVKGPERFRATYVYPDIYQPPTSFFAVWIPDPPLPNVPGYYKYTIKYKGKGGGVVKGSYKVKR